MSYFQKKIRRVSGRISPVYHDVARLLALAEAIDEWGLARGRFHHDPHVAALWNSLVPRRPKERQTTLRHTQSTVTIVSTMSNPTFWYSFTAMPIHHGGIVGVQHWCAPPALSSFARAAALWNSLVRLSAIAWARLISPGVTPGLDRFQSATL